MNIIVKGYRGQDANKMRQTMLILLRRGKKVPKHMTLAVTGWEFYNFSPSLT